MILDNEAEISGGPSGVIEVVSTVGFAPPPTDNGTTIAAMTVNTPTTVTVTLVRSL